MNIQIYADTTSKTFDETSEVRRWFWATVFIRMCLHADSHRKIKVYELSDVAHVANYNKSLSQ